MGNRDLTPRETYTLTSTETSATIEAGMAVGYDGLKLPSGNDEYFAGVALFDAAYGEAISMQHGIVDVLVTGTGSLGDGLQQGATAGKLASSTSDVVLGFALEAWTAAGTIRAFIFDGPRRVTDTEVVGSISFGSPVGSIADTASAYVAGCVSQAARTISAVTAYPQATCTDAEDHVIIDLYKISSGTATKIWSVTTAADWTDAGLAMVMETGGAALAAGDVLHGLVTNETGSAIVPNAVIFDVTATVD